MTAPRARWRDMGAEDRAFVVSSWASSYRDDFSAGIIHRSDWHNVIRTTIGAIIDGAGMRTIVMYSPDAEPGNGDLLGFICGRKEPKPYVAYCYVAHAARGLGLARWAFEALGVDPRARFEFGCRTRASSEIIDAGKLPAARWNPVPLRTYERQSA